MEWDQDRDRDQYQNNYGGHDVYTSTSQGYIDHHHHYNPDQSSKFDGWKYDEEKDSQDDVSNDALLAQMEQEKEARLLREKAAKREAKIDEILKK